MVKRGIQLDSFGQQIEQDYAGNPATCYHCSDSGVISQTLTVFMAWPVGRGHDAKSGKEFTEMKVLYQCVDETGCRERGGDRLVPTS